MGAQALLLVTVSPQLILAHNTVSYSHYSHPEPDSKALAVTVTHPSWQRSRRGHGCHCRRVLHLAFTATDITRVLAVEVIQRGALDGALGERKGGGRAERKETAMEG